MRRFVNLLLPLVVIAVGIFATAVPARAASAGVQDGGSFFSADTLTQANDLIRDIHSIDNRDVLVVTFAGIPQDRQDEFKTKSEQGFFSNWAEEIGRQNATSGVVILLTREPGHLQIEVGNKTRQHSFTIEDRDQLKDRMLAKLKEKKYDDALLDGLGFIKEKMKRATSPAAAQSSQATPPYSNSPGTPSTPIIPSSGFPIGGLLCAGVGILLIVFTIMKVISNNRGYGGGYGAPPPGGYPPGYSGGYPQGGGYGYGGGGGGGFGRGLLGGLLGGALGAWGYDRFNQSNTPNYTPPPPSGGGGDFGNSSDQTDTSYSGTGGDFGSSSPPDSSSSGGDFGSSSDSSSSSDFGGGGGGDFGGGGDSGGSSTGGDF